MTSDVTLQLAKTTGNPAGVEFCDSSGCWRVFFRLHLGVTFPHVNNIKTFLRTSPTFSHITPLLLYNWQCIVEHQFHPPCASGASWGPLMPSGPRTWSPVSLCIKSAPSSPSLLSSLKLRQLQQQHVLIVFGLVKDKRIEHIHSNGGINPEPEEQMLQTNHVKTYKRQSHSEV